MRRSIQVFLGDQPGAAGIIRYNAEGARESAVFEYDRGWLSAPGAFALEPGLPLVLGPQFRKRARDGSIFNAILADTEPDGWARRVILRDHAKRMQQARRAGANVDSRPLNHLDFLLEVDDGSRVGALRFRDEEGIFRRQLEPGRRTAPPLIELTQIASASRAIETNTETAADLEYLRGRGTSVGGLRPKCTVVDEQGRLSIGKFPSITDERAVTKGEVLAMQLAKAAGINAAEARLIDSDGIPVALIRRFDRPDSGGRLLYASAATMLGAELSDPIEHDYTEIVDALRMHGAAPQQDAAELWRRIAFSILITNVDDHLHNHGFLHGGHGQWRLAPAFDLNPFPDRVRELKTWISPTTGAEATIDALLSAAPYFQISQSRAKEIVREVDRAVARWQSVGRALEMSEAELEAFAPAFEHGERETVAR